MRLSSCDFIRCLSHEKLSFITIYNITVENEFTITLSVYVNFHRQKKKEKELCITTYFCNHKSLYIFSVNRPRGLSEEVNRVSTVHNDNRND